MCPKFAATVMVLGVVFSEGDVMEPHVFPKGLRVNTAEYPKVMIEVVEPWMRQVAHVRNYVWQQDGAPAHTSNKTQQWCQDNLPLFWEKELWPPSSTDCNPLDYFVWSLTKRDVKTSSPTTPEHLSLPRSLRFSDSSPGNTSSTPVPGSTPGLMPWSRPRGASFVKGYLNKCHFLLK